ncbi:ABC transporter permease [Streptacidiphilus sp. PB12-B1b]|uniref:ABC transporter permease n=1 Tax=Streptacidiphilus sp. PB12-B1b TaxID=2705012 RepID=UPI0015F9828F|nr:ABC transporter permease [Streptacidiphilus sp. PB12-B1b]QMU76775.1 ABC transporter permease [Streptacidiphilus sp. PB12-B1b]
MTAATRVRALGRAELTLLLRNRTALAVALLLPVGSVAAWRPAMGQLSGSGAIGQLNRQLTIGGIGLVLLYVVYYNLVTAYVARREERVLKRLRTGEPTDLEILAGTAVPAVAVALAQCLALVAAGTALLHLGLPRRPDLLLAALVLGIVMQVVLAAASSTLTRSVELAQLTTAPLLVLSAVGSGLLIPLASMPQLMGEVCRWLPLTPVLDLVRAGWVGGAAAGPAPVLRDLGAALAWTLLSGYAVRRWFRWEPRR